MVRTKHVGIKKQPVKGSGSSNPLPQEEENIEVDPFYAPELQAQRLSQYLTRHSTTPRYTDMVWFSMQGFEFPSLINSQGLVSFMELQGNIYPNLVKEFYANFHYKDTGYESMIRGVRVCLNAELFLVVGDLFADGVRIGDCDESWANFDSTAMYISCLRHPDMHVEGTLKKAGNLTVEDRLLHYLIVYILTPRLLNLAQPTTRDLQLMYVIKNEIPFDWPAEILRHMHLITQKKTKVLPLAYSIFISRIVDHFGIDVSNELIENVTPQDHLIDKYMLRKMNMAMTRQGVWVHESEIVPEVEEMQIDSGNEEDEQPQNEQGPPDVERPADIPPFSVAHLDAMEQRMYARMEGLVQGLGAQMSTRMDDLERQFQTAMRLQTETLQKEFSWMNFDANPSDQP